MSCFGAVIRAWMGKSYVRMAAVVGGVVWPPQELIGQIERPLGHCRWDGDRTVVIGAVADRDYGLTAIGQVASPSDLVYVTQPQARLIRVYHHER